VAGRSIMAEVNRERVLLVGGQRALVMQLAHPLVAAGVDQHSDFPARARQRLRRTLDLSLALIYGSEEEAAAAARAIRGTHRRVVGVAEGTPYRADDPELLLWVNATLVDTALVVYQRFVRPLSGRDRERYYAESVAAAERLGIPRSAQPEDIDAFGRYVEGMLEGGILRATDAGRRLVRDVLAPPVPLLARPPTAAFRRLTVALLPEPIRVTFGLRATAADRVALATVAAVLRAVLPVVPPALREFTRARAVSMTRTTAG
jgi:uncharacterized protein (DUF2236 family)